MIRANNPEIDVFELMKRVRSEAERIRVSGAAEQRTWRDDDDRRVARAVDRHHFIAGLINEAEESNRPRREWPRRLQFVSRTGPIGRFFLRLWNYLFKQQREKDTKILQALREMLATETLLGDYVLTLRESIRIMEANRNVLHDELDRVRPQFALVTSLAERISGLEKAHHETRQLAAGASQLAEAAGDGNVTLKARVDSAEGVLQSFSDRLAGTPTHGDVQIRIADSAQTQRYFLEQGLSHALRSDALIRAELADVRRSNFPRNIFPSEPRESDGPERDRNREALYLAIEDNFRGSRDIVSERLAVYLPMLRESAKVTAGTPLLDLGAGRGEFVSLLNAENLPARGVESNALAVAEGQSLDIPIEHGDLFDVLARAPDNSVGAISAIHVIEHLPFERFVELCEQSLRVLVPGGVLLLETPNPANMMVASKTFYFDPTHLAPVPSELAKFIVESIGFSNVIVHEMHPSDERRIDDDAAIVVRFNEIMYGPQDYAIIAHAPAE